MTMPKLPLGKFSEKKYAVPFGRYVGSSEVQPPADEVLVGREGQRAYLIDLLISTGRRGAYLVTGRRGTGKSSFVKHCVAEYEASVFSRFLRGNVGKGVWDRVLILFAWAVLLLCALLVSELIQILSLPADQEVPLRLLTITPLGILLLYPCVYSKVALETILKARPQSEPLKPATESHRFGTLAAAIVATAAVVIWFFPGSGKSTSISIFIPIICGCYLFIQAASSATRSPEPSPEPPSKTMPPSLKERSLLNLFLLLYLGSIALAVWPSLSQSATQGFLINLGFSLTLLSIGHVLRGYRQQITSELPAPAKNKKPQDLDLSTSIEQAMTSGSQWYHFSAALMLLLGLGALTWAWQSPNKVWTYLIPSITFTLLLLYYFLRQRNIYSITKPEDRQWRFRSSPHWIIALKSLLSILVALLLAHPFLANLLMQIPKPTALPNLVYNYCADAGAGTTALCNIQHPIYNSIFANEPTSSGQSLNSSPSQSINENAEYGLAPNQRGESPSHTSRKTNFVGDSKQVAEAGEVKAVWLLSILSLIIIVHLVEYEWVLRPYLRSREERLFEPNEPARWEDWHAKLNSQHYHNIAQLTFPWLAYKSWLPVLTVSVNLGFDRLGHRQVIQGMLVGLRERYHRTFLAWNSGFANLGRLAGTLLLLALMTLFGGPKLDQEDWFPTSPTTPSANTPAPTTTPFEPGAAPTTLLADTPAPTATPVKPSAAPTMPASLPAGTSWLQILNKPLFSPKIQTTERKRIRDEFFLVSLLPSSPISENSANVALLRFYHILIFFIFLFFGRWLLIRIPILPYRENLRRIDDLLDSLSVRTRVTSSLNLWGPARWVYSFFSDERVRETEQDPVDPRTVELAFLQILEDMQKGGFRFPGAARHHLTLPSPEITFIFDELDKLGTRVDPELTRDPLTQKQESEVALHDRERFIRLRALLSDLKNILASAPARFIFVGGRDLHDEWLADQSSRQPLLTSIFNTEVYLPSLMTDHCRHDPPKDWRLHRRTQEYLLGQHTRAHHLHKYAAHKRWSPSFGLSVENLSSERYVGTERSPSGGHSGGKFASFEVIDCAADGQINDPMREALLEDFTLFLTHRSMGNAKRLKDLLASFIRQAGREINYPKRWSVAPCRHILRFDDTEIFRVQLLVDLYRHLTLKFEDRMVRRDDKYSVSVSFLTDFLFKFHRRAFSWSNLERVDDLAHIHRLPDLRDLQEEIVNHFSERFLHRVLNGMYAFRFRSDIAAEVEYLSRLSASEMAAFNFTLDESQSLKAEYEAALKGKEGGNPDLVAALGELFEFDQDFESARYYYRLAIEFLDKDLKELTARVARDTGEFHPTAPIRDVLAGESIGLDNARRFLAWGVSRLRLMLQIGMTFEHAHDLERAEAEYRNARTLARSLIKAFLGRPGRTSTIEDPNTPASQRLHSLKHLNILFEPLFAEAWLSEKFVGAIDTSISLIENGLRSLRSMLPFVGDDHSYQSQDTRPNANFALTISQLHNKAGDIYFFKGRQPTTFETIQDTIKEETEIRSYAKGSRTDERPKTPKVDRTTDGYLLRAHYHYALGLHDLRHYVRHRVKTSAQRLSITSAKHRRETLISRELPDFLFRAAAGSVNDMAEATLARVSLFGLLARLRMGAATPPKGVSNHEELKNLCDKWLGSKDGDTKTDPLANWFGAWAEESSKSNDNSTGHPRSLIEFTEPDPSEARLLMSIGLCMVGASYFERGGYPENAARELLQVCETVTRYLWWGHMIEGIHRYSRLNDSALRKSIYETVEGWTQEPEPPSPAHALLMENVFGEHGKKFWPILIQYAVLSLERAYTLFQESRHVSREAEAQDASRYLVGSVVPPEALTLLCSLGIAVRGPLCSGDIDKRMQALLKEWTGRAGCPEGLEYWAVLGEALERHRFPMLNRLNGLKILVDAVILGRNKDVIEPETETERARQWTERLLDLNSQYDAPLHFTPLHSGTTCALLWLRWISEDRPSKDVKIERIYRAAQRDLHNSEEMYTMRRAYYESINDLYYLYDDFNDRQIHFNHAIQMAGAELTSILKCLIDLNDK